ncbi:hypothetical protein DFH11DRAFT_1561078 [Phellopilus nigrolimitatus]|nr:hypothetical protein DFH11DRAFT_1561078 [Phellopilus nigrolimitatus]
METVYQGCFYEKSYYGEEMCFEARVMDVGTGSGAWALDFYKSLNWPDTSIELYASDVSSALFPRSPLKGFLRFDEKSALDLASGVEGRKWHASWNFVHQRLLSCALTITEWPIALSHVFYVLNNLGVLQLVELAWDQLPAAAGGMEEATDALEMLQQAVLTLFRRRNLLVDNGWQLPAMLKEVGFKKIVIEEREAPVGKGAGEIGRRGSENFNKMFKNLGEAVMKEGGLGMFQSEADYLALIDKVEQIWDETSDCYFTFRVICATKLSTSTQEKQPT